MKTRPNVFDAHFHIGPYGSQSFANYVITPIQSELDHHSGNDCIAYLNRYAIKAGVIVPTYLENPHAAFNYNSLVIEAVDQHENLYGGLWVSPLPELEARNEEALARVPHLGIRALKIASNTWQPFSIDPASWSARVQRNVEQILEVAAAHQLIIHFHTGYLPGADPIDFDAFMRVYGRKATYQLVHLGEAIAPSFKFVPRFITWIEKGFDVYTDTSVVPGFAPLWLLNELSRKNLGFDRLLFATDTPWGRFPSEYWKVEALDVEEAIKEQIFWTNARRLYGGPRRS
jgi:predicted TIM-barrel fold metal-dependent hydrolase